MTGINRQLIPDARSSLFDKHLPGTSQVERLLRKEGKAHVFNDRATLDAVAEAIIERGYLTGVEDETDDYERYGLYFEDPIGYQVRADGSRIPLYYAEIKLSKEQINIMLSQAVRLRAIAVARSINQQLSECLIYAN